MTEPTTSNTCSVCGKALADGERFAYQGATLCAVCLDEKTGVKRTAQWWCKWVLIPLFVLAVAVVGIWKVVFSIDWDNELLKAVKDGKISWRTYVVAFVRPQSLKTQFNEGWRLLHYAAGGGSEDAARFLLDRGADVNATDNRYGMTPLHGAAYSGPEPLVRLLLDRGSDVTAKDGFGITPLHRVAAGCGSEDVCGLLLNRGADVDARDEEGWTPLHWAAWKGQKAVVSLLLDHGAEVNAGAKDGRTPLDDSLDNVKDFLRSRGGKAGTEVGAESQGKK